MACQGSGKSHRSQASALASACPPPQPELDGSCLQAGAGAEGNRLQTRCGRGENKDHIRYATGVISSCIMTIFSSVVTGGGSSSSANPDFCDKSLRETSSIHSGWALQPCVLAAVVCRDGGGWMWDAFNKPLWCFTGDSRSPWGSLLMAGVSLHQGGEGAFGSVKSLPPSALAQFEEFPVG